MYISMRNIKSFVFPLQVENKPCDGVANPAFILELGMVKNSNRLQMVSGYQAADGNRVTGCRW
jgi:hypothetical protein